jgi:hypothetical protein
MRRPDRLHSYVEAALPAPKRFGRATAALLSLISRQRWTFRSTEREKGT